MTLEKFLNPGLFDGRPVYDKPLTPPVDGERVYELSEDDVAAIRRLRGAQTDLHPGMGGVAPERLLELIEQGTELTSLDFMLTRGCNFNCTWCFAGSSPKETDTLPFAHLRSLTVDACGLGVGLFVLTGGEPLMYRDPDLDVPTAGGGHFFAVVDMILDVYKDSEIDPKILTFDDVALITPGIAQNFANRKIGLCTKGDTLIPELQDYKVNQKGAFKKMMTGYDNLLAVGYGRDPDLRLVVNSVLDHTTFDGMIDLHFWVLENGFDHSIVPVHYCGNAEEEDQEAGIHSHHVKVLYDLLSEIDRIQFNLDWQPWSAFTYNKTCNRNRSGLHIRADGDVTACSESPSQAETSRYTFGNVFDDSFSLKQIVKGQALRSYRSEFGLGHGLYVCSPKVCDLYANDLCQGGCATRSAYSKLNSDTGCLEKNDNPENYSNFREDPLCPAWTVLAEKQGVLRQGLLKDVRNRLLSNSLRLNNA